MTVRRAIQCAMVCGLLVLPALARAQSATTGSIAGVAKDTTGAVLPGVTVEAASPALIEKVKVGVTDDQGQYKIVDLRSGVYTVTFSLAGFNTIKREQIELTTGFTATVNADMKVGSLEETITVTGASPIVDTQNVRNQNVLSRDALETLPVAHSTQGYAALTLGVSILATQQDVGGNRGESVTASSIHGNRAGDATRTLDGMGINTMLGTGGGVNYYYKVNDLIAQEVTLTTDGQSAEYETGGLVTNIVPKEGGNKWSMYSNVAYSNKNLQSSNLSPDLIKRNLLATPLARLVYDAGLGLGGPVKQDKLWFYTAHRAWGAEQEQPNLYFNATPNTLFYTKDLSRPSYLDNWAHDSSGRVTWQVNSKNKINYFLSWQRSCTCWMTGSAVAANLAPDASTEFHYDPIIMPQVTWSYTATNRLLFEAGASYLYQTIDSTRTPESKPGNISVRELTTGITYGASQGGLATLTAYGGPNQSSHGKTRFSMSYVTGSHAVKVGLTTMSGVYNVKGEYDLPIPVAYTFNNQVPSALTEFASPHFAESRLKMNLGIYGQDQWTLKRLTLNMGLRFSYFNAYNPAQTRPAGYFVPVLQIAQQNDVPNWKDLDPRVGAAYDLFGNGKTAVKASLGRYVAGMASQIAQATNPANAMVTQANRNWNDSFFPVGDSRRGNFVPDCDLKNPLLNDECGNISPTNFGTVNVVTTYAGDVLNGFGVRPYTWQGSATVQQQLLPNVALMVGYFRTSYGNFTVTDNLNLSAADYDPYSVTAPTDTRLPGGGGYPISGLYDIKPASTLLPTKNLIRQASDFGKQSQVYSGVDVSLNARLGRGIVVSGGMSTGQTVVDDCAVRPDSPDTRYCNQTLPYAAQTQYKFNGVYPLPWWGIQTSATFQNLPGIAQSATRSYLNAEILPSLGRNLGSCGTATTCNGTASVANLFEPNVRLEDRLTQVDLRLTKVLRMGRNRVRASFEIYNVLNANTITQISTVYGSTWLEPRGIVPGRLFKFGAQYDF